MLLQLQWGTRRPACLAGVMPFTPRGPGSDNPAMPDIDFTLPDGSSLGFEAADGISLMQAATGYGVPGILADCGGALRCATCHVRVAPAWVDHLPPPSADELAMLGCVADSRGPGSRLACQIQLHAGLQGLRVQVPERQL